MTDRELHDDRSPSHRRASFNDPLPTDAHPTDHGASTGGPPDDVPAHRQAAMDDAPNQDASRVASQGGFGAKSPRAQKRDSDTGEDLNE